MLNQYKIDVSPYFDTRRPYALFMGRRAWWGGIKWEYITSFPTKDEAREAHRLLTDLPIGLTSTGHALWPPNPQTDPPRSGVLPDRN